jgi:peptidyl-tRNA hydrolase, PTH1 family
MKLFVGLGNPGREYEGTRHNMGFKTLDKFAELVQADFDREEFKGVYTIVKNPTFKEPIILCKPQTFMNLSGTCVSPLAAFFKIPLEDIVVVYDDMALPEGTIRLRENGASGGHKGIQSIIEQLGSDKIRRIRVGIGEPPHNNPIDYVLGKPVGDSLTHIENATDNAAKALRDIELRDFAYAMSIYNSKVG